MSIHEDGVPPDSIEALNFTREVASLVNSPQYKEEEQAYLEMGKRMVLVCPGSIPGTLCLWGHHNWPDEHLGEPPWMITFMGRVDNQLYPLRFKGDEQLCLSDLALFRLSVP